MKNGMDDQSVAERVFVTQDEPALDDDSLGGLDKLIGPDQRLFASSRA